MKVATRQCLSCREIKPKACFSKNQYKKGNGTSRCKLCVGMKQEKSALFVETTADKEVVLLDALEKSREVTTTAEIESLGGAMYDRLRLSSPSANHYQGMDLEEFSASLSKAGDLGLNNMSLEVNSD